jgi:ABC-type branched-subunit amino acid transport system ATPase component
MAGTDVLLELDSIEAGYGRSQVLNGLSLGVGGSETIAVLGPNGSGKSTVAKTIMGLTDLFDGRVVWNGKPIQTRSTARRARLGLAYVPQVDNVFRGLSVNDNLLIGANALPTRRARHARVAETYGLFPRLYERRQVSAEKLSGGERRMLSFATAIVNDPKLMLLDEPTSDLAPATIDQVMDKIVEIRDQLGIPVLLIEQNAVRALEIADDVCVLVRGRVVLRCRTDETTEEDIAAIFLERAVTEGADGDG